MYYLTRNESEDWRARATAIAKERRRPADDLLPATRAAAFHFHVGAFLAAHGQVELGDLWFQAGATLEEQGLTVNAFVHGFMERQQGRFCVPTTVFADPQPFVHFATVPAIRGLRAAFLRHVVASLPRFARPFRIVDIGCGSGAILVELLQRLRDEGKINDAGEILLVDRSAGMLETARRTVSQAFPRARLAALNAPIEAAAAGIGGRYDVMLNSLSYHHLPMEQKRAGLLLLREHADHFIYSELDAGHDTPELFSPELSYSVYQFYGRLIDMTFAHDAPVGLVIAAVDNLLMTEAVSLLIEPRGKRNDYHMLKRQWQELLDETLGAAFTMLCDSVCYSDDQTNFFTLHYGR